MLDRIEQLEQVARQLEPDPTTRTQVTNQVVQYANAFLDGIYTNKAYHVSEGKGIGLLDEPIGEDPIDINKAISLVQEQVDKPGLNPASGGHLGYIPGGGIYYAALGDYMADVANNYAGVYYASPGAVRMENMLLDWMASVVGYPVEAAGNLASGGSIANLIAIVTARDAADIKAKDFHRAVIYTTEQVHHCVNKAIRIAGLTEAKISYIPIDEHYRLIPEALDQAIRKDKAAGNIPLLAIASAGTTDTGAVDPLDTIGDICTQHNLWYHVDGAYGAFFILVDEVRPLLHGMSRSDSIVMDPHKGLFLPYGTGAMLTKHKDALVKSHYYQANYLQDAVEYEEVLSPADVSPELTKHFRGLRLWLPLKLHGLKPFKACLEEKILLARYFYEAIQKINGFEVGPYPDLSVVTYRYLPNSGDANAFNEKLFKAVRDDGRVFISSTMLNGNYTLRLACLAFRTHKVTIDLLLQVLQEKVSLLLQ